jgi:hypothetical protein
MKKQRSIKEIEICIKEEAETVNFLTVREKRTK